MKNANDRNNKQDILNNNSTSVKEWMNSTEAASYLSISEASLRNLVCKRKIIPSKLGRRNRYHKNDLLQLIEAPF